MKIKKYFYGDKEILVGIGEDNRLRLETSRIVNILGGKYSSDMLSIVCEGDKNTLNEHREMDFVSEDGLHDLLELKDDPFSRDFKNWLSLNATTMILDNPDPSLEEITRNALKKMIIYYHIQLEESIKEYKDLGWQKESGSGECCTFTVMRTEEGLITIGDYAQLLSSSGYPIDPTWIYDWLLENEYVYCSTNHSIVPSKMHLENNHLGYVIVRNGNDDSLESDRVVPMITPIGQVRLAYYIMEEVEFEFNTCLYSSDYPALLPRWMRYTCRKEANFSNKLDKVSYGVVYYKNI